MNSKRVIVGAMLVSLFGAIASPVLAETDKGTTRIEKLEERTRDLEARMAKVEASSHKQMGMMQHGKDMMDKGMGNSPMGQQPPQQVPPQQNQNPGMGGAGMPPGGMGHM